MTIRRLLWLLPFALLPSCQQQMADQPSVRPDEPSTFFADGRSNRPALPGTVARGHLKTDAHLYTGRRAPAPAPLLAAALLGTSSPIVLLAVLRAESELDVEEFPFEVTRAVLEHGRNRYMIHCVVCHDALGTGQGTIVARGYTPPPSLHIDRLRQESAGHFFTIMTRGYGSMPAYRDQLPARSRWAIAAYIRALQLSQHFPEKDLTPELWQEWKAQESGGPTP